MAMPPLFLTSPQGTDVVAASDILLCLITSGFPLRQGYYVRDTGCETVKSSKDFFRDIVTQ